MTSKKTRRLLLNPGRWGVVYDEAGHSLGGTEHLEIGELDSVGQRAVDCGHLQIIEVPASAPVTRGPEG